MMQNSQQIASSSKKSDGRASLVARVQLLTVSLTSQVYTHTHSHSQIKLKSLAKIGLKIMRVEIKIPTHALTAEWL